MLKKKQETEKNTSVYIVKKANLRHTSYVFLHLKDENFYLTGRFSCILAIRPIEGSERVYMVARIAMTTNNQENGLAGYTPFITLFY